MKEKPARQYQDIVALDDSPLALKDIESIASSDKAKHDYEKKFGKHLYSSVLLTLTHEKYDDHEAELLWNEANTHLDHLTARLGRNPGIAVAVLDYLVNIKGKLSEPVIIEEQKSEFMSETTTRDQLTQLYLRSVFDITLHKEIQKSNRNKTHLTLLLMDVDDFKQVNDKFGHVQGDKVLSAIGKTLNRNVRAMDMVARYGGEEMAIIMPAADVRQSTAVAERIRRQIANIDFKGFSVTVSIGIGHTSTDPTTPENLIAEADTALYQAKGQGKNQVVAFGHKESDGI